MKPSPPGRFRDLHLLIDEEKRAERAHEQGMYISPQALEGARQEMEANYEHMVWKKEHKIQGLLGIRLSPLAVYGMILVIGAAYIWFKYGTIEPFPKSQPNFTITQWLREK
jgi:hypothetical protein